MSTQSKLPPHSQSLRSIPISREKRVKILQQLVINKLNNFPPEFKTFQAYNLGLILSKSEGIIAYLEEAEGYILSQEERGYFNYVENIFKDLVGVNLSLTAIDKNASILNLQK